MIDIKSKLIKALDDVGIFLDNSDDGDFDLRDYILDSLQFISAIVQIESEFGIEFPGEFLLYDNLMSFNSFCKIIEALLEQAK